MNTVLTTVYYIPCVVLHLIYFGMMTSRWKLKCKKLERDLDRIRHSASHVTERNEQLIKELEVARSQAHSGTQHVEHIKREFAELLVRFFPNREKGGG